MAKLTIEVDTQAKTYQVSVDGKVIDNVNSVSMSNWGDDVEPWLSFCVETSEKMGDSSDVYKSVRLCGSKTPELTTAQKWLVDQRRVE